MKRELKYLDPSVYIDWVFRKTLKKLAYYRTHAPGISVIGNSDAVTRGAIHGLVLHPQAEGAVPSFLDFGARDGARQNFAADCSYTGVDINPRGEAGARTGRCSGSAARSK